MQIQANIALKVVILLLIWQWKVHPASKSVLQRNSWLIPIRINLLGSSWSGNPGKGGEFDPIWKS